MPMLVLCGAHITIIAVAAAAFAGSAKAQPPLHLGAAAARGAEIGSAAAAAGAEQQPRSPATGPPGGYPVAAAADTAQPAKGGDGHPASLQTLATKSQPPRPDDPQAEAGLVRATTLEAQKLYSRKGAAYAQVEDLLIDPKTARITGFVADRLDPSGRETGQRIVVPLADVRLEGGRWLITSLGGAPSSQ